MAVFVAAEFESVLKNSFAIVKAFFWVNLWNSFDLVETLLMRVFVAAEFESVLEILLEPFLVPQEAIFAQN